MASHRRSFGRNEWLLNPFHYLETLKRKPGAFDQARPLKSWREKWPLFYELTLKQLRQTKGFSEGTREFIEILQLHEIHSGDQVEAALQLSAESGSWGLEAVKLLLHPSWSTHLQAPSLPKDWIVGVTDVCLEEPNLTDYDQLLN